MASPHPFSDTHAHLCDESFDKDRPAVMASARSAGARWVAEIACVPDDWPKAAALAQENAGFIVCAFGLHPQDCLRADSSSLAELKKFLSLDCARALGEIGFDYAYGDNPPDAQRHAMRLQCALANETGLPLVLHCRNAAHPAPGGPDAYADLFSSLKAEWNPARGARFAGVLHCFSGSYRDAVSALDLGLALGVNGTATYPKNDALRETLKKIGLRHLVLETDCPYLPPQPRRGKRNEPAFIPETAVLLAEAFNAAPQALLNAGLENGTALYRLE